MESKDNLMESDCSEKEDVEILKEDLIVQV
jgi:hypothetical protein